MTLTTTPNDVLYVRPCGPLQGTVTVPGDKSITHRAILFGLLAEGETRICGWLDAADCRSSLRLAQALGAQVRHDGEDLLITGTGGRLQEPGDVLDCGNSGTTMRVFLGPLAARVPFACLTGDASLRRRPMQRVADPLAQMGAHIHLRAGKYAPLSVTGQPLQGIEYRLPVASAQVKSAILMAGVLAESGETTVVEPEATRDHTENMLEAFAVPVTRERAGDGLILRVPPQQTLRAATVHVPGDLSSAAFVLAAGLMVPGSKVQVLRVGLNETRTGMLRVLERMGAHVQAENVNRLSGEWMGDLTVTAGMLRGTEIEPSEVPSLIDELPILAVLAACAEGPTVVRGAKELRVKETDRIAAITAGLRAVGVQVDEAEDGFTVYGRGVIPGGEVDSQDDHRIAMSFAVAGMASQRGIAIHRWSCVGISYPTFTETFTQLGWQA
ncbi:MAG: 3-phosphoshikimate 1-carboxyvinyltransferase [Alicyclobacillus sp.]|nr:3-phosphoshikimate 1-carboxyvinyltransferase [Alicyclobacillus sp.]